MLRLPESRHLQFRCSCFCQSEYLLIPPQEINYCVTFFNPIFHQVWRHDQILMDSLHINVGYVDAKEILMLNWNPINLSHVLIADNLLTDASTNLKLINLNDIIHFSEIIT